MGPTSPNVRGALWMLAAAATFSGMQALVKALGSDLHFLEIVFFRSLFGLLPMVPFMLRERRAAFVMRRPGMHLLRGMLGVAAMVTTFYALTHLPLATAVAIFYAKPLFMIVLAAVFLAERAGWRRWLATAFGFVGVLLTLRPGALGPDALSAVAAALFMSGAMTTIKRMTGTENTANIVLIFGLIGTLATALPAALIWRTPSPLEWSMLLAMGVLGGAAQYMMVRAYALAEATVVTPVDYTALLFAGLIGWMLFGELPDAWTVAGALVIAASTLYIVQREARLRGGR
ncbi:MAG: DMT family transporter [Alphaproteobacteria bacterium]|nr:DMT family transporter [Alphaproteobacteria bacterium]